MSWTGKTLTTPFPASLLYDRCEIKTVKPMFGAPGVLACEGLSFDLEGKRIVQTDVQQNRYLSCRAELGFEGKGKHMFGFAVEDCAQQKLWIGVCTEDFSVTDKKEHCGHGESSWSMDAWGCYANHANRDVRDYGTLQAGKMKNGDIISVLVDLDTNTISYLRGDHYLGVSHSLPEGKKFYPCVTLQSFGQAVIVMEIEKQKEGKEAKPWAKNLDYHFPPSLHFQRHNVQYEYPEFEPELTQPGLALACNGRKVFCREDGPRPLTATCSKQGVKAPGKYLFTYALETYRGGNDVLIGLRTKECNVLQGDHPQAGMGELIWGYTPYQHMVLHEGPRKTGGYGEDCHEGDVIAMLVDLNIGALSFFHNDKPLGLAAPLPLDKEFFPTVSLGKMGTSVLVLRVFGSCADDRD